MGDFDALANGNTSTKPTLISSIFTIIILRLFHVAPTNAVRCFFFGRNFKNFGALSRLVVAWLCLQMSEFSKVAKSCFLAMIDALNVSIKAVILVTVHDGNSGGKLPVAQARIQVLARTWTDLAVGHLVGYSSHSISLLRFWLLRLAIVRARRTPVSGAAGARIVDSEDCQHAERSNV